MKEIIGIGIILMLAGCGTAISRGQTKTAESIAEGWYSPNKTDMQLSQDRDQCTTRCLTA